MSNTTFIRKRGIKELEFDIETLGRKPISEIITAKDELNCMENTLKERVSKCVSEQFREISKDLSAFRNGQIDRNMLKKDVDKLLIDLDMRISKLERIYNMKIDRYFVDRLCDSNWKTIKQTFGG